MANDTAVREAQFGERRWAFPGPELQELRDSSALRADPAALRARLADDGYLLLRGFHDRDAVLAARRVVLRELAGRGFLEPGAPLEEGRIGPSGKGAFLGGFRPVTHAPEFLAVVESPRLLGFFADLFGAPALTYDYKWLRAVVTREFTGMHYDVVYMGRGTHNLLTCWTPIGDVPLDQGPLALCLGSQHFDRIRDTYGRMDVDRDHVTGWFSNDPAEIVRDFGGQWATAEFRAGDVLLFGMYLMHGSLSNTSGLYRLSADTRYQRRDEPVDERWIGDHPKAHYAWFQGATKTMADARREWGV